MTRCIPHAVIASAARQSIFLSMDMKENGLPRPLRDLAMTVSWVKCSGSWYIPTIVTNDPSATLSWTYTVRLRQQVNHYKKSIFSLWITFKVIISNNKLDAKCSTWNIFEFLYPLATTERPGIRCR